MVVMDSFCGPGKAPWIPVREAAMTIWFWRMTFHMHQPMELKLHLAETKF